MANRVVPEPAPFPMIANPSFEQGLAGWISSGVIEHGGHEGAFMLTHYAGKLETTQTLKNLNNGWYTLKVWVRSSGGQKKGFISLKNCGGVDQCTSVPIAPADQWLQIVVSAKITHQQCTISLFSEVENDHWVSFDDIKLVPGRRALSILGADISSLKKSEDKSGIYLNERGIQDDALKILRDHGINYARLRVWVNSPDGYHGKAQLLEMAKRLKTQQIKLLVDFHYSDSWADPGKQYKPRVWENLNFENLKQALYAHTLDICNGLKAQGTPADMVQIGNEITNGMLWPEGKNDQGFDNLATLLKEGYRAVKECSPSTLVMLHLDNGGKNELYRWWFDHVIDQGVPFDLIGTSYYPYWHGTLADLQNNLDDIAQHYCKDIVVVETAYAFTPEDNDHCENIIRFQECPGYPFTPEGQAKILSDIMTIVRAVPDGHGLGIVWWEATWTAVPGNGWDPAVPCSGNNWENQALFDFQCRPLPAMSLFNMP
ncbi:MAG: arabinogalactan endo-1,4-beta-galactosidase [Anaerolineales bacterium]